MRIDVYLTQCGNVKSRTRAKNLIEGGLVTVNGQVVSKASFEICENDRVEITGNDNPFVGRGGLKLDKALDSFGICVEGLVCADIGASTGGFTDCLLKRGARKVFAIDAGHGQLDGSLLENPKVINLEGVNARNLTSDFIGEKCDMAVMDLSFISQKLVMEAVSDTVGENGILISLIKPQFECGRAALNKNGIVKDRKMHVLAIKEVFISAEQYGLVPRGLIKSPILGGDGNTEFLMYAVRGGTKAVTDDMIKGVVYEENK